MSVITLEGLPSTAQQPIRLVRESLYGEPLSTCHLACQLCYTNVINCAVGAATFAVDTHIFRVGNRTGLARGKTPLAVEKQLEKKVPQPFRVGAHHWLILHGRYVCKARTPECWRCPVVDLCAYNAKVLAPKGRKQAPA